MKIKTFSVQMMQFPAILFFIFGVDINGAGLVPAKRQPAGGRNESTEGGRKKSPQVDAGMLVAEEVRIVGYRPKDDHT